jgi:hypothetical protein
MKMENEFKKLMVLMLIFVFVSCALPTAYAAWEFFNDETESSKDSKELTPEQKRIVELFKVLELSRIKIAKSPFKPAEPVEPPAEIYKPFEPRLIAIDLIKQVAEAPARPIQPYKSPAQITEIKMTQ